MKRSLAPILCMVGALAPLGCGSSQTEQPITTAKSAQARVTDPQVSAADSATFASDNQAFALDAYHKLAANGGNLVFSPLSVSFAMAMTYAGAVGSTASEMATAMHFSLPPERLHPAFDAWDLALATRGSGKLGADGYPMQVSVVNAAWAERTYTFQSSYLDTLAVNYGAGINLLDFIGNPDSSRITINDWVAQRTADKITDLLATPDITSATRLVLTNAVYLNAAWNEPFDPSNTRDGAFTLLDGSTVTTKLMGAELVGATGLAGAGFSAVSLPYQDTALSLLLVVPDEGTFAAFESAFDGSHLDAVIAGLTAQQVILSLPRFSVETPQDFVPLLESLGMTSAFQFGTADLSGMDGTKQLYISKIAHKAFIAVAEKGTEAAAATAVVVQNGSAAPSGLIVSADRPFLFFLRDQPTGAILFAGRVLDPTKG